MPYLSGCRENVTCKPTLTLIVLNKIHLKKHIYRTVHLCFPSEVTISCGLPEGLQTFHSLSEPLLLYVCLYKALCHATGFYWDLWSSINVSPDFVSGPPIHSLCTCFSNTYKVL